ncbi:MAG: 2-oxoglutarate ferredoxin oxidoreductase subunit delta [Thermotogota bacterium]|nr:2-oxoglutarate ferredoxin oxidoreductase subunit delta [Thermotogota bacterium]MDK2865102.1 2-oxoglutarate ferredoxin oxidoreductase subunit delta [Thermotogota bacterium]HCZ06802.1 ferredoxin [Thermotogota bacterium]
MAKRGNYHVDIDLEWCKRCGICYAVCPTSTIKRGEMDAPIVEDHTTCIGCMMCENLCPDFAIDIKVVERVG